MKKYQLWLERKSYSQHLTNLIKIKHERSSIQRLERPSVSKNTKRSPSHHGKQKENNRYQSEANRLGDISYAISFRDLKNGKMRFMKAFELLHQNTSMAKRIREAKSVVIIGKQKSDTVYDKRRKFEKKCEHLNEEMRQKTYKKFMQMQNQKSLFQRHRFEVKVELTCINLKNISNKDNQGQLWCEIDTDRGIIRSDMVRAQDMKETCFIISLQRLLPMNYKLRVWYCKGLESQLICELGMYSPKLGQNIVFEQGHNLLKGKLYYDKVRSTKSSMFRSIM